MVCFYYLNEASHIGVEKTGTGYLTGMRSGEVRGLRWEHVDLEAGIIYLPSSKTCKDPSGLGQRVVMQRELIDLFKSPPGPARSEWVFFRWDGGPFEHWDIQKPFKALLESLGIDTKRYSWKELRHTTGSLMNLKGAPPLAIKDQLRHTSFETRRIFTLGRISRVRENGAKDWSSKGSRFPDSGKIVENWSRRSDLNRGPTDYGSLALPLSYAGSCYDNVYHLLGQASNSDKPLTVRSGCGNVLQYEKRRQQQNFVNQERHLRYLQ